MAVNLIGPRDGDRILDYGTGDGYFLKLLYLQCPSASVFGYEPQESMRREIKGNVGDHEEYRLVSDLSTLPPRTFNKIACLEVFEHLPPPALANAIADIKRLLAPNGKIVVSVPVEIGPSSLLKNLARLLYRQQESSFSSMTLLKSLFGLPVERREQWGLYGHTGFDHRAVEDIFRLASLKIRSKSFCPFPLLRGLLNSQVFFVLSLSG